MMTPEQAGSIFCPVVAIGRLARGQFEPPACAGPSCAMWRWAVDLPTLASIKCQDIFAKVEPPRPDNVPASWTFQAHDDNMGAARWIQPAEETNAKRVGYCGLAGIPEFRS